ncbi:cobalt-precorrin-6A reductase [Pseudooceanicola sp. MF1-13]|uniref:cobalt-precorrin-6A reductase n=1 Tax=Pseudooceanicola sp. MF1-13 TaxID=3379095 RepID=UPI0038928E66
MILLLAGTAEARDLARRLAKAGVDAQASVAGAVAQIDAMPLPSRVGGFGGDAGFAAYLDETQPTAIIDATHPFAARITDRTARICADRGIPYLRLDRPAWEPGEGDQWHDLPDPDALASLIPEGAAIFLSVGRKDLPRYAGLSGRKVVIRSIDPPGDLPDGWISVLGKPPFPLQEEVALFQDHAIDWLVTKNAGGASSATKLIAARHLKLPVAMIARPPLPNGIDTVATAEEALIWALRHA